MSAASDFYVQLQPFRDLLLQEKNPQTAWESLEAFRKTSLPELNPQETRALVDLTGLILRGLNRYKEAADLYRSNGDHYQAGYCELLLGNLYGMQSEWALVLQSRSNHWCLTLFGLVTQQLNCYATMLQIRNHLEGDIGSLLRANRWDYLQNIIQYADLLAQMNMESPKFIGRGILNYLLSLPQKPELLNSPLIPHAEALLLKGQKVLPNDPEVYYHLGQFRHMTQNPTEARLMLKQCLLISPSYTPAKELIQALN